MNNICTCRVQSKRDRAHPWLHSVDCYLFPPTPAHTTPAKPTQEGA